MTALSNYAENALANHVLRNIPLTALATVYIGVHTAVGATESTADWLTTEVSGSAYARVAVAAAGWGAPSDGVCSNLADVTFPSATGVWGTITHFSVWDALTTGNLLFKEALAASRVIGVGDVAKFTTGFLQVGLR